MRILGAHRFFAGGSLISAPREGRQWRVASRQSALPTASVAGVSWAVIAEFAYARCESNLSSRS
jgi:hypothetical protein